MIIPRNFLVFINPMAGTKKGASEFRQRVLPMFDLAEIKCEVVKTSELK